jgi:hypothetical protein
MKKFTLDVLIQIIGLGSASGVIYSNGTLLVIGDSSGYLYEYSISKADLQKHGLVESATENIAKSEKADLEAMSVSGDDLFIFGSGSGRKRNVAIEVDLKTKDTIAKTDLKHLYSSMREVANIPRKEFNIEGAFYSGDHLYLFNRGNGTSNRNVIFTVNRKNLIKDFTIQYKDIQLPQINGFRSGFSDAILVENKIYFIATGENTSSTTADGRILGTLAGRIDLATMTIDFTEKISDTQKFEGLTLYSKGNDKIEFLLCEDNDTVELKSNIYKLTLSL